MNKTVICLGVTCGLGLVGCGGQANHHDDVVNPNLAPTASFTLSTLEAQVNDKVQFTSTSTDDTGLQAWVWDFGDGNNATFSQPVEPEHTYSGSGVYAVTLTVTDDAGVSTTSESETITIHSEPILPQFNVQQTATDLSVAFTDSSEYSEAHKGQIHWHWDFGDGVGESTEQHPTYEYTAFGLYTVVFRVTDASGRSVSTALEIDVTNNPAPIAQIEVFTDQNEPLTPKVHTVALGELLTFDGTKSSDNGDITEYRWNFGDNSDEQTGVKINHRYSQPGLYTTTLTVTDDKGKTQVSSFLVNTPVAWRSQNIGDIRSTSPVVSLDNNQVFLAGDGDRSGNSNHFWLVGLDTAQGTSLTGFPIDMGNVVRVTPIMNHQGQLLITPNKTDKTTVKGIDISKGTLLAINPTTADIAWHQTIGTGNSDVRYGSLAVDQDGDVYISQRDNGVRFAAVSHGGADRLKWAFPEAKDDFQSTPVISSDGHTVFACDTQGTLHAMKTEGSNGKQRIQWSLPLGKGCSTSLALGNNDTVYVLGSSDNDGGFVAAVSPSGELQWQFHTNGDADQGGVALNTKGHIIVGTKSDGDRGKLLILDSAGKEYCHYPIVAGSGATPAVDNNDHIYIGDETGNFHIVDSDCNAIAVLPNLGTKIWSSAAIDDNGNVYVGVDTGKGAHDDDQGVLIKLVLGAEGPAASNWPMRGQNAQRTGQIK